MNSLDYLLSDDPTDPVVDAALSYAERLAKVLKKRRRLSAREAMFLVMLRRIRELEEENLMLRRLG
jgi:hypothetical protein